MKNMTEKIESLNLSTFNVLKDLFGDSFEDAINSHTLSAKENISRIVEAIEKSDSSQLIHAAHSLKGASSQFGALALSDIALKLEEYGQNNMIEKARELIDELQSVREEAENLMLKELA